MKPKKIKQIFTILLISAVLLILVQNFFENAPSATVIKIYDGDTLQVSLSGKRETIRLIGIDTPEIKGKYTEHTEFYGMESKRYLEDLLPVGTKIFVEIGEDSRDPYDRLLAYIRLETSEMTINEKLLKNGYAKTLFIEPNMRYQSLFLEAEKYAKKNNLGIWQEKKE